MVAILFWVVIVGFSFVLELHSNAFIAVFIGFGAAISFVLALAGLPFTFQAGAWLVVSGSLARNLRPFAMRKISPSPIRNRHVTTDQYRNDRHARNR